MKTRSKLSEAKNWLSSNFNIFPQFFLFPPPPPPPPPPRPPPHFCFPSKFGLEEVEVEVEEEEEGIITLRRQNNKIKGKY